MTAPSKHVAASGRKTRPHRVAMVGAGQLARMSHQAAISLGVELTVMADSEDDSAVRAGAPHLFGSADDIDDLRRLAAVADVVTFDHEGVAPELLEGLEEEGVRLNPGARAKLLAQDKLHARQVLDAHGYPVPAYAHLTSAEEVRAFAGDHGWPIVLKAPRGGYDGRGVWIIDDRDEAERLVQESEGGLLAEEMLAIDRELAVIVARSPAGDQVVYPVVETVQEDAMCREIVAPAPVSSELAAKAADLARGIAEAIGATGVMALELFECRGRLLVNELALRPHNSGHYSIEGCTTSQFEQHLRAVLDLPLGSADLTAASVATVNVVGPADGSDPADRLGDALAVPQAHVHLYGKEARPGRKLGHVTVCGREPAATMAAARRAAAILEGVTS